MPTPAILEKAASEDSPLTATPPDAYGADNTTNISTYTSGADGNSLAQRALAFGLERRMAMEAYDQGGAKNESRAKKRWRYAISKIENDYEHYVKARSFVLGVGLGASCALLVMSIAIMYVAYDPSSGAIHALVGGGFYSTFRAAFLLSFWALLVGLMQFLWRRANVPYHAHMTALGQVNYASTLVLAFSSLILVFYFFIAFVLQLLAPAMFANVIPKRLLPLLALLSPGILLLWPTDRPPLFFFRSAGSSGQRWRLVQEFFLATAGCPFAEPSFLRTLIADVLCSMPKLLTDLQHSLCVYTSASSLNLDGAAAAAVQVSCSTGGSSTYAAVAAVLSVLPFFIRLVQSTKKALQGLRDSGAARVAATRRGQSGDDRDRAGRAGQAAAIRNATNSLKYTASLALLAVSLTDGPHSAWVALSIFCTAFNYTWDVVVDWGLTDIRWAKLWKDTLESNGDTDATDAALEAAEVAAPMLDIIETKEEDASAEEGEGVGTRGRYGGDDDIDDDDPAQGGYESTRAAYYAHRWRRRARKRPLRTESRMSLVQDWQLLTLRVVKALLTRPALADPTPGEGGGGVGGCGFAAKKEKTRHYPAWVYLGAAVSNGVLRFGWAIYVSPNQVVVQQHTILLLACAELVRRFNWAVIRVEWQSLGKH